MPREGSLPQKCTSKTAGSESGDFSKLNIGDNLKNAERSDCALLPMQTLIARTDRFTGMGIPLIFLDSVSNDKMVMGKLVRGSRCRGIPNTELLQSTNRQLGFWGMGVCNVLLVNLGGLEYIVGL